MCVGMGTAACGKSSHGSCKCEAQEKHLGKRIGKPDSQQQAAKMLKRLRDILVREEMKTKPRTFY